MTSDFIATAKAMPDFVVHDLPPSGPDSFLMIGGPCNGDVHNSVGARTELRYPLLKDPDGPVDWSPLQFIHYNKKWLYNIFGNPHPVFVCEDVNLASPHIVELLKTTRFAVAFGVD